MSSEIEIVRSGDQSQVNRLKSKATANTRNTQMAVSSSNGGLGLPTGDLAVTVVWGTIGIVAVKDASGGSWGVGGGGESRTTVSGASPSAACVTPASGIVCGGSGTTISGFEPPGVFGSGKHSRFDFSQRGQTQFLDLGDKRGVLDNRS